MAYPAEKLVDNPVVFLQLDELGAGVNGQTVPDTSGNGLDGSLIYSDTVTPWGYASVINDPVSRAFRGMNAGLVGATDDITSRITVPNDALMAVTNDFACEGRVRVATDIPLAGTFPLIQKQGSGGIAMTFSGGTKLCGYCFDTAATLFIVPATFRITDYFGESFHVVVVRQSNILSLYINGYLNNQITITSGLGTLTTGSAFNIHSDPGFYDVQYDEALWYTNHLSSTRVLAHYEEEIPRQPMYATINARSSFLPDLTPPPVYQAYPLRHNFDATVVERLSRLTNVQQLKDGREERTGAATKTRRTVSYDSVTPDAITRRAMASFLWSNLKQPCALPIMQDTVRLTAAALAGDTVIYCDTEFRDFDADSRARLGSDTALELVEIDSLDTTSITLKDPLINNWPKGTRVSPAKLAYLGQDVTGAGLTREVENFRATGSILIEDIPTAPNRITPYTPSYTYLGTAVFDPGEWQGNDYSDPLEYSVIQQGELQDNQTGIFAIDATDTNLAQQGLGAAFWLKGRETISNFLGWFEAQAGRLNKIWVPTMQRDFDFSAMTGNTITLQNTNYAANYNVEAHRKDICLIQNDGTFIIRRIVSVASEILTTDNSAFDSSLFSTTKRICFMRMCRLDADELELVWHTSDVVRVVFKFREVLHES